MLETYKGHLYDIDSYFAWLESLVVGLNEIAGRINGDT